MSELGAHLAMDDGMLTKDNDLSRRRDHEGRHHRAGCFSRHCAAMGISALGAVRVIDTVGTVAVGMNTIRAVVLRHVPHRLIKSKCRKVS